MTATFGPRYTWSPAHARYSPFAQALAREANGINNTFPATAQATSTAHSVAVQLGGGMDIALRRHFALRLRG